MDNHYSKITVVTPSLNQDAYLEETILSVLHQNYPNLEYIIIDGGSSDNSVNIIKKYEKHLKYWVSEPDKGIYHAVKKGFSISTGDIMTWINSDDILAKGSLSIINQIFNDYDEINWVTGNCSNIDERSRLVNVERIKFWSRYSYFIGDYKFIQQEGTFWKRKLWEEAGGFISQKYKFASDLELWSRFFTYDELYSVDTILGFFRMRSNNQLSLENMDRYLKESEIIVDNYLTKIEAKRLNFLKKMVSLKVVWRFYSKEYNKFFVYPPRIFFDRNLQKFVK